MKIFVTAQILGILVMISVGCGRATPTTGKQAGTPSPEKPSQTQPTPFSAVITSVITDEEFYRYNKIVFGALGAIQNDPETLPAIRDRLMMIAAAGSMEQLEILPVGGYWPSSKDVLSHIDYDAEHQRPQLMIFLPALIDREKSVPADVFRLELAIAIAHEGIHLEQIDAFPMKERLQNDKATMRRIAQDEALAWAKTIIQIIRPLEAQGKPVSPGLLKQSERFRSLGDDPNHPAWVESFTTANYSG